MLRDKNLTRALVLVLSVAFFRAASAQTLVLHDTFDIGAATPGDDPDDPLDAAWNLGEVVDDSAGIGSGNALVHQPDNWGEFLPFDLPNLGDAARLSWDFRFDGEPISSPGNAGNGNFGYRLYLSPVPVRSMGYGIRIGTGGDGVAGNDGNGIGLRRGNQRMGPYGVPPLNPGQGQPTQNSTFTINDNEPHSASVTVTRTMVQTEINGVPTGLVEGIRLDGEVDGVFVSGVAPFGFENEIGIQPLPPLNYVFIDNNGVGGAVDLLIDNVRVELGPFAELDPGDVNEDGSVDETDFDIILANWYQSVSSRDEGDLNRDGLVSWPDFREWKENSVVTGSAGVPEPSAAILMLLAAAGLSGRWRGHP